MQNTLFDWTDSSSIDPVQPKSRKVFRESDIEDIISLSTLEARNIVPLALALKYKVFPLKVIDNKAGSKEISYIATAEKLSMESARELRFISSAEINIISIIDSTSLICLLIKKAYLGDKASLIKIVKKTNSVYKSISSKPELYENNENDIVQLLERIVTFASVQGASDIHIDPQESIVLVKLRIGARLIEVSELSLQHEVSKSLIRRIKVLANLDTTKKFKIQDGLCQITCKHGTIRGRIVCSPTVFGERVVFRLNSKRKIPDINSLGISESLVEFLKEKLLNTKKAILFVGSTRSGKTTSLYAAANFLQSHGLSIVSIEDPVELIIPETNQTDLTSFESKLSMADAIKAVLRQDPDVIILGEIRDKYACEQALNAALLGKTVLATIHSRNSYALLARMNSWGINPDIVVEALDLIVVQRLLENQSDNDSLELVPNFKICNCEKLWKGLEQQSDFSFYSLMKAI